jgi:hypothetical protein
LSIDAHPNFVPLPVNERGDKLYLMRLLAISVACGLLGSGAGCLPGSGKGAVDGSIFIRQCAAYVAGSSNGSVYSLGTAAAPAPYAMDPSFFIAEPVNDFQQLDPVNRVNIREQSDGSNIEQADVLYVNVASDFEAAMEIGTPIAIGPNTNVRATLALNQTCPFPEVTPTLEGTMTFTSFGTAVAGAVPADFNINLGDRLTASFDFDVVDVRAATIGGVGSVPVTPAVSGNLTGYFDFVVRRGQSAQSFP